MKFGSTRRSLPASTAATIVPSAIAVAQPRRLLGMIVGAQETAKIGKVERRRPTERASDL